MFVPGKHFLPGLMPRLGLTLGEHLVRLTVRVKDCKALLSSELTIREISYSVSLPFHHVTANVISYSRGLPGTTGIKDL
jgi:hypothetical protein